MTGYMNVIFNCAISSYHNRNIREGGGKLPSTFPFFAPPMGIWKCLFAFVESFKVQQLQGDVACEPQTYFRSSLLSLRKIKAGETRLEKTGCSRKLKVTACIKKQTQKHVVMSRSAVCLERTDFASQSKPPIFKISCVGSVCLFLPSEVFSKFSSSFQAFLCSSNLLLCFTPSFPIYIYIYISFHSLFRLRLIIVTCYNSAAFYPRKFSTLFSK